MPASFETRHAVEEILNKMSPLLDEKQKRILYGIASEVLGHGGTAAVHEMTGASRNTITSGIKEADSCTAISPNNRNSYRIRKPGAGRKTAQEKNPGLYQKIEEIVKSSTYGSPMKVITWTTLSLRKIAAELAEYGYNVSQNIVSRALEQMGYSKQQNQKNLQVGEPHPDRDAQFRYIDEKASDFLKAGDPVISVDTKKKELIGNFKNNGAEYCKTKNPRQVLDHDFELKGLGKIAPYGVYVVNDNTGYVNLGTDHDTSEFAIESIARWWFDIGKNTFPNAKRIYINADGGGSNRTRGFQWKYQLQQLSNITGLEIHMSHFPPGTSKWNKIEHRLFCYITKNREGKPLTDLVTVVNLISSTTTEKGLKVKCVVDYNKYELNKKITEDQVETINIESCDQFGNWNYIIRPNNQVNS